MSQLTSVERVLIKSFKYLTNYHYYYLHLYLNKNDGY